MPRAGAEQRVDRRATTAAPGDGGTGGRRGDEAARCDALRWLTGAPAAAPHAILAMADGGSRRRTPCHPCDG